MSIDSLSSSYTKIMQCIDKKTDPSLSLPMVSSVMDLTCLNTQAPTTVIEELIHTGLEHRVAGICLFPDNLNLIPANASVKRVTVVNFPEGNLPIEDVRKDIHRAITHQLADEIDYVFPYALYLSGHKNAALSHAKAAYEQCANDHKTFKIIVESGAFPTHDRLYEVCVSLLEQGCDFLKTSTGKRSPGATLPAVFTMLSAIKNTQIACGIKVSGGVKSFQNAVYFIQIAQEMLQKPIDPTWFRIGTSQHTLT